MTSLFLFQQQNSNSIVSCSFCKKQTNSLHLSSPQLCENCKRYPNTHIVYSSEGEYPSSTEEDEEEEEDLFSDEEETLSLG